MAQQPCRSRLVLTVVAALGVALSACSSAAVVTGHPGVAHPSANHPSTAPVVTPTHSSPDAPGPGTRPEPGRRPVVTFRTPPTTVFDAIGAGTSTTPPARATGPRLTTAAGRPRVLYVGAEYCPYCASERWALAAALSRFGRFGRLGGIRSSPSDVYPNTASITFHGASFTSSSIGFTGIELTSTKKLGGSYAPLDHLDPADRKVFVRLGASGAIPFVDIGGRWVVNAAGFNPAVLRGASQARIVSAMSRVASPIARAVDGAANLITAAICTTTAQIPRTVCRSRGIRAARSRLPR